MARFLMWVCRGMCHSLVWEHIHLFSTASSDTFILTDCSSYKFTSLPSQMDTYPASANLTLLSRELSDMAGTMSNLCSVSRTLCYSLETFEPAAGCPSASTNIFLEGSYICMKGYPILPAFYVHAVSHADEGMVRLSTTSFGCSSVSGLASSCLGVFIIIYCCVICHSECGYKGLCPLDLLTFVKVFISAAV